MRFGPVWTQALVMGILTAAMQFTIYGSVAVAAARGRDVLIRNPTATIWTGRTLGAIFIMVALVTVYEAVSRGL